MIWNDDSQLVEFTISQWYSSKPRIEVEIIEVGA
ncbi:RusA family crossover junction endodeoxyribonuclease [Halobacillus karajensis]|nr:RusA family crossover junction endodeoxyribonuclease [Halobacillus karajensis]